MNDFYSILNKIKIENPNIDILFKSKKDIEKEGFSRGYCVPKFKDNKLEKVIIIIDKDEYDEVLKIKVLFHEIGHAKDYINRKKLLESCTNNFKFNEESEFYAFENSLIEALKLYKYGRTDILISLINNIPNRINDDKYKFGVIEIMKTELWRICIKQIKDDLKN